MVRPPLVALCFLALLCSGCPGGPGILPAPHLASDVWAPSNPLSVYPPHGPWVLRRDPMALVTFYGWDGTLEQMDVPFEDIPVLTVPEDEVAMSMVTFEVSSEFYTQGALRFDPPIAGEVDQLHMHASRTPEGTQYVRDHGPTANFSTWEGEGPSLAFTPTGAAEPYTLAISGGGGLFGCYAGEDMSWAIYWHEGEPWQLYKTYVIGFSTGFGETPPGTCGPGLDRLRADLEGGMLPADNLWRRLDDLGVFGADRHLVGRLGLVAIQVKYVLDL